MMYDGYCYELSSLINRYKKLCKNTESSGLLIAYDNKTGRYYWKVADSQELVNWSKEFHGELDTRFISKDEIFNGV